MGEFLYGMAAVISALASLIAAIMGALARRDAAKTQRDMRKVELATNSMKDELVEATRLAATAVGVKQGRADQKAEHEKGEKS